jgi:hypothetical protein
MNAGLVSRSNAITPSRLPAPRPRLLTDRASALALGPPPSTPWAIRVLFAARKAFRNTALSAAAARNDQKPQVNA